MSIHCEVLMFHNLFVSQTFKMPFWPKCCSLNAARKTITVEPVFLFFSLANNLRAIVFQTLLYEKVCSDMFNSTVCKNLKDPMYKEQETGVQKV